MKKWVIPTIMLLLILFNTGCVSRVINPSIEVTANQQKTGTHTENLVDVQNSYAITFNILNNGTSLAKNVKIDYSYCDDNPASNLRFCKSGSFDDIGDLQPHQKIVRTITYDRSGFIDFSVIQKFHLKYSADSEV